MKLQHKRGQPIRVVHVSSVHPWTDNRINLREAVSLSEIGYHVSLVALDSPNTAPASSVHVYRLPRRSRVLRATVGSAAAVLRAIRLHPRVVHLHDPELIPFILPLRLLGKRVVFDAHEDLENQVRNKPYVHWALQPPVVIFARMLTRMAAWATHVVAATPAIARRFPVGKVTVVHNYARLRDEDSLAKTIRCRAHVVVYVGGLSTARGARQMVEALSDPEFPDGWMMALAGPWIPQGLRGELTTLPAWDRVKDHGVLGPSETRDLLLEARVGLVVLQRTAAYEESLPTKIFEYMSAGIPVIASDFPLWRHILSEYECGQVVDETNPTEIASAIRRYADDPSLLEMHARNSRRAAETVFNWSVAEEQLTTVYRNLE